MGSFPPVVRALARASVMSAALPFIAAIFVWVATCQPGRVVDDFEVTLFQSLYTSAPFWTVLVLKLLSRSFWPGLGPRAVMAGFMIICVLWVWYAADGYIYQTKIRSGGASIGMGLAMMALPLLTLQVMGLAVTLRRRTA